MRTHAFLRLAGLVTELVIGLTTSIVATAQVPAAPPAAAATAATAALSSVSTGQTAATPASATAASSGAAAAASGAVAPEGGPLVPPVWQNTDTSFLKQYPHLRDNLYQEPDSHFRLGVSAGLLGLVANRQIFSANFFQVHFITPRWDIEGLSISYAQTTAHPSGIRSSHFIFRTSPKFKIFKNVSLGPLIGYEFISFPDVSEVLQSPQNLVTKPEPFSAAGLIYGGSVAETLKLDSGLEIRLTQVVYKENYSVTDAGQGWVYSYASRDLRTDPSPLAAGVVALIEAGILF